jgi:hypothetical protein
MLKSKEKISIWKKPTEKADKFPGAGRERKTERLTGSTLLPFFCPQAVKGFLASCGKRSYNKFKMCIWYRLHDVLGLEMLWARRENKLGSGYVETGGYDGRVEEE